MTLFSGMVEGKPIPQGSVSPMPYIKKSGGMGVSVFQKKELLDWREKVAQCIRDNYPDLKTVPFVKGTPVYITLTFIFDRPKSVSEKKRPDMIVKPDLDKMVRSFGDAMTNVLYDDDSQIVWCIAKKKYRSFEPPNVGLIFEVTDDLEDFSEY